MSRSENFKVSARGARVHGSNDIDALFPDGAPTTALPMQTYNRRRGYDRDAVRQVLSSKPTADQFVDVDPRELSVSQPSVLRAGVKHYMSPEYEQTGQTFADHGNVGNQYPVVYDRHDGSERITLSGHHRAVAALLRGTTVRMRRVQGP